MHHRHHHDVHSPKAYMLSLTWILGLPITGSAETRARCGLGNRLFRFAGASRVVSRLLWGSQGEFGDFRGEERGVWVPTEAHQRSCLVPCSSKIISSVVFVGVNLPNTSHAGTIKTSQ